jgi:hypothetical protein
VTHDAVCRLGRTAALAGAAILLAACSSRGLGSTGVQIHLSTDEAGVHLNHYELWWLDETRRLLTTNVPDSGRLSDVPNAPAVVYISLAPEAVGPRRVVARGVGDDGGLLTVGAAKVTAVAGQWVVLEVVTSNASKVLDSDRDGIPDSVDGCPMVADPCPSSSGDAAAAADGPANEGGAGDGAMDGGADGAPDAAGDGRRD